MTLLRFIEATGTSEIEQDGRVWQVRCPPEEAEARVREVLEGEERDAG